MSARQRRGLGAGLPGTRPRQTKDSGQAVVELALTFPLIVLLLLGIIQVGLVVRDQILVVHASREAARVGAVDSDPNAPRRAAVGSSGLSRNRMTVESSSRGGPGSTLSVTVHYDCPTEVPLIGAFLPDVRLRAVTAIRVEV